MAREESQDPVAVSDQQDGTGESKLAPKMFLGDSCCKVFLGVGARSRAEFLSSCLFFAKRLASAKVDGVLALRFEGVFLRISRKLNSSSCHLGKDFQRFLDSFLEFPLLDLDFPMVEHKEESG